MNSLFEFILLLVVCVQCRLSLTSLEKKNKKKRQPSTKFIISDLFKTCEKKLIIDDVINFGLLLFFLVEHFFPSLQM